MTDTELAALGIALDTLMENEMYDSVRKVIKFMINGEEAADDTEVY